LFHGHAFGKKTEKEFVTREGTRITSKNLKPIFP
jgi:hypothetical protein